MMEYIIKYGFDNIQKDIIIEFLEMKKINSEKGLAPPSGLYLQNIIYDEKVFEFHKKNIDEITSNYYTNL